MYSIPKVLRAQMTQKTDMFFGAGAFAILSL
jgi:hypothetical protein